MEIDQTQPPSVASAPQSLPKRTAPIAAQTPPTGHDSLTWTRVAEVTAKSCGEAGEKWTSVTWAYCFTEVCDENFSQNSDSAVDSLIRNKEWERKRG